MENNFNNLVDFINEMKSTSSTNEKTNILKKYDSLFLRKLFEYVYSPFKQYGVTSKNLKKHKELKSYNYTNLFSLLDALDAGEIRGHVALAEVNGFIENNESFSDVLYDIIDRDIKTRATSSLINKVMPNTIPVFEVALANKFQDHIKKVKFDNGEWWASRKLDGLRCITIFDKDGEIRFFSRQGKEFFTFNVLKESLSKLRLKNKVLDGEICIINENGLEDFQSILKEYNRKNHTIKNPKYYVFDYLELDEFLTQHSEITFVARQIMLNGLFEINKIAEVEVVEQICIENKEHFDQLVNDAQEAGFEGIMIRKDVNYEGKRTSNLLKVKQMFDAEYQVVGYEVGIMRIIENGVEVEEEMLKNVRILHKGCPVDVGSGFSLEQRRHFYKNPNDILNKIITVQYFEQTQNQNGKYSLRFPVIKAIHGKERTT